MIVVGLMSGTSMDGLDLAVGEFTLDGDQLTLRPMSATGVAWPTELRSRLLAVLPPGDTTVAEICALDTLIGKFAAQAVTAHLDEVGIRADLIASHGQTVFHWIEDGHALGTLQLGQPAWLVEATGLPVVSDVRSRDVAAGGHGAPLASTLDALWLADNSGAGKRSAALNLGGIANVTVVGAPTEPVVAFDTGPANCLLDVACERLTGTSFDVDGKLAATGTVRTDALDRLLADPYYRAPAPKSTGREYFDGDYVDRHCAGLPAIEGADLLATLVELTAVTVADALAPFGVHHIVASGGGVRNRSMLAALARRTTPATIVTSDQHGLPSDAKEAYLLALLGFLTWHQVPGIVAGATGSAIPRVLGRINLGDQPVQLPAPGAYPTRLVISTGS